MKAQTKAALPSMSLPPLALLDIQTQEQITSILASLAEIYCPLSTAFHSTLNAAHPHKPHGDSLAPPAFDSGYASETNEDEDDKEATTVRDVTEIREDAFERDCATRWVTGFIVRAEESPLFKDEEGRQAAIEDAYTLVEALSFPPSSGLDAGKEDEEEEDVGFKRDWAFKMEDGEEIKVHLVDKLAGQQAEDPDDVGLQSWGASILFSRLFCENPARFGLQPDQLPESPLIVELGAGTGLVSLTLGALLPKLAIDDTTLVATDYHPAVLENLQANVEANAKEHEATSIETRCLDWSDPDLGGTLAQPADILFATDVIYSPEHAMWLRDCAARMLSPNGVFWLVAAVRQNGKFEGVSSTVRKAFAEHPEQRGLRILENERMEKSKGVGRGDESWYEVFKIGWV